MHRRRDISSSYNDTSCILCSYFEKKYKFQDIERQKANKLDKILNEVAFSYYAAQAAQRGAQYFNDYFAEYVGGGNITNEQLLHCIWNHSTNSEWRKQGLRINLLNRIKILDSRMDVEVDDANAPSGKRIQTNKRAQYAKKLDVAMYIQLENHLGGKGQKSIRGK